MEDKVVFETTEDDLKRGEELVKDLGSKINEQEEDPDDMFEGLSERDVSRLIKNAGEMVEMMESIWNTTRKEFNLTDSIMKDLYQYNEQHKTPMPEGLTEDEQNKFDQFNGIDNITDEEIIKIFGNTSPILYQDKNINYKFMDCNISRERIKQSLNDFVTWLSALKEYKQIHAAWIRYLEYKEEAEMEELKKAMEAEEDKTIKQNMQKSILAHYYNKYLTFLSEPIPAKQIENIVNAYGNEQKTKYWITRSIDKLKQMNISTNFILEISGFEKRFLPEKYHPVNNTLLIYVVNYITFANITDTKSIDRDHIIRIVVQLDNVIGNRIDPDSRDEIMKNIMKLLDQFVEPITQKYGDK